MDYTYYDADGDSEQGTQIRWKLDGIMSVLLMTKSQVFKLVTKVNNGPALLL